MFKYFTPQNTDFLKSFIRPEGLDTETGFHTKTTLKFLWCPSLGDYFFAGSNVYNVKKKAGFKRLTSSFC